MVRRVGQLTPELAEEVAEAQTVVLVDADAGTSEVFLDRVKAAPGRGTVSHSMTPGELIMLAERLYGFHGVAYMCHVPAESFAHGDGLTPVAEAGARAAADNVMALVDGLAFSFRNTAPEPPSGS
jgi:Ni,Fe-hydrogenase maturation factor